MSFVDRRIETRPSSGEAPFKLNEVFFSRTDKRGVIEAGNYIFRRVADYDWPELIGAPHKVIRHPDMPRAVFQLLWDTIKGGGTVGQADHCNDQQLTRHTMHVVFDQRLHTFAKVEKAHNEGQCCNRSRDRAGVIGQHLFI